MNPKKLTSSPSVRDAWNTTAEEPPFSGGPNEVGVELEEVDPRPTAERRNSKPDRCARYPPRSTCFLVEDCKWCRSGSSTQDGRGDLSENIESLAVRALRTCLADSDRDCRAAEVRRALCLDHFIERYLVRRRKSV